MTRALKYASIALELLALCVVLAIAFRLASDLETCERINHAQRCALVAMPETAI